MGEGSMKKDKKEYCLTQKEVIEIINREREGGIKAGHEVGVSTVNPENTIKVLEKNTVDREKITVEQEKSDINESFTLPGK